VEATDRAGIRPHPCREAPSLRAGLKDPIRNVRAFAAAGLGILGDKPPVEPLAGLAGSDPDGRACAIYGVAKQLVVHSEWVNSPSVFVIDRKSVITYAHVGSSWGDRRDRAVLERRAARAGRRCVCF
jgi:hypothetical protein